MRWNAGDVKEELPRKLNHPHTLSHWKLANKLARGMQNKRIKKAMGFPLCKDEAGKRRRKEGRETGRSACGWVLAQSSQHFFVLFMFFFKLLCKQSGGGVDDNCRQIQFTHSALLPFRFLPRHFKSQFFLQSPKVRALVKNKFYKKRRCKKFVFNPN